MGCCCCCCRCQLNAIIEFVAVAAGVWLEYTASVAAEAAVVTAPAVGSAAGFAGVTIAAATVVAAAVDVVAEVGSGRCTGGSSLLLGSLCRLDNSLRYDHWSAVGSRLQLAQWHRLYGLRRYRRGSCGGGTATRQSQSLLQPKN